MKKRTIINKNLIAFILVFAFIFLMGCEAPVASFDYSGNIITINEDNSIDIVLKDSFDKDYYSENDLVNMVNSEINEFNASHFQDAIKLGSHSVNNGIISLEMIFAGTKMFNEYMPGILYTGNVAGAQLSGYDLNQTLKINSKDGGTIGKSEFVNLSDKLIIVNGIYCIKVPGKITYYSDGMNLINNNAVAPLNDGTYYVLYK